MLGSWAVDARPTRALHFPLPTPLWDAVRGCMDSMRRCVCLFLMFEDGSGDIWEHARWSNTYIITYSSMQLSMIGSLVWTTYYCPHIDLTCTADDADDDASPVCIPPNTPASEDEHKYMAHAARTQSLRPPHKLQIPIQSTLHLERSWVI